MPGLSIGLNRLPGYVVSSEPNGRGQLALITPQAESPNFAFSASMRFEASALVSFSSNAVGS